MQEAPRLRGRRMKRMWFGSWRTLVMLPLSLGFVVPPYIHVAAAQVFAGAPTEQTPGLTLAVDPAALATPYATGSASNFSQSVTFPAAPTLAVPAGFGVNIFARTGLSSVRNLLVAPNGDVFVAEQSANRVSVLRDADGDGRAELVSVFAGNFTRPYGLALTATNLYVADTTAVWRLPYTQGATSAASRTQVTPSGALGDAQGHDTRNIVLSPAGDLIYVAIGSRGNIAEEASPRATIQEFRIDGTGQRTFASGLRNPVGVAFYPGSMDLFTVVNERDGLGDELVPDYLARVVDGGFYGWPYAYAGRNVQPNFPAALTANGQARIASTRTPELMFRSHSAPLGMAFTSGTRLPPEYRNGAFVALHGSWNASVPRGYMVVFVPFAGGQPSGGYRIFASGFWASGASRAQVIGRPAAVAMARDGAVLIADDVAGAVWRVASTTGATMLIGVLPGMSTEGQSYIRLYNGDTTASTATLVLRSGGDGRVLGGWTSPPLAPRSSRQFAATAIEAGAGLVSVETTANYVIELRSSFNGAVQHVVWNAGLGTLENMTRCDVGPSPDLKTLINVHSTRLSAYPSRVRIYNAGAATAPARLTAFDAATGGELWTWTSPAIDAGAMIEVPVATLEASANPAVITAPDHYVLSLDAAYPGVLQHIATTPAGISSDLSERCALTR